MSKTTRKRKIEEILNNFERMKHKIASQVLMGEEGGITHAQWMVLYLIEMEKKTSIKDISSLLGVSSSAATQVVNSLEHLGYAQRWVDQNDRRELHLIVSKKGKKEMMAMRKRILALGQEFFAALTEQELKEYAKLQRTILSQKQ